MKTDRELLELAAKAAGIEVEFSGGLCEAKYGHDWMPWNPLTDDGDALWLAVKLGISLEIDSIHCDDPQVAAIAYGDVLYRAYFESDPYAATRRAIVRAAAAIGESIP